jgi:hypothetical protein
VWISHDTSECRASEVRLRTYCKGEGYPPAKFNTHTSATCRERPRAGGHRRHGGLGMMEAGIQSGLGSQTALIMSSLAIANLRRRAGSTIHRAMAGQGHLWGHRPSTR